MSERNILTPLRLGVVSAKPHMPHGHHQLAMLRAAAKKARVELVELSDEEVKALLQQGRQYTPKAVGGNPAMVADSFVSFREDFTYATACLDPHGNDPEAVALLQRKDEARECLRTAGFLQPATAANPEHIPGPWVVKPRTGSGSRGVSIHDNIDLARAALAELEDGFVEELVIGTEFSAEGFFFQGKATVCGVSEKRLDGVVEIGHRYPTTVLSAHEGEIATAVADALRTLGLRCGIFHFEGWWVDGVGVILGEGHVRPGGDYIHLLVSAVHGCNIFEPLLVDAASRAGLAIAEGQYCYPPRQPGHAAAVRYLQLPEGIVTHVSGVQEALRSTGVIAGNIDVRVGQSLSHAHNSTQRIGCLVAHAGPGQDPDQLLDEALQHLQIKVK